MKALQPAQPGSLSIVPENENFESVRRHMLNFIHLSTRTTRTLSLLFHASCQRSIFVVTAVAIMIVTLCSSTAAQRIIPQTVQLQTAYVGVPYSFAPRELLPARAPRLKWSLVCT